MTPSASLLCFGASAALQRSHTRGWYADFTTDITTHRRDLNLTSHCPLLVWKYHFTLTHASSRFLRCFEALVLYFKAGKVEEPYVTISRKIALKKGHGTQMELEIGQKERMLATHMNAFKRTAVIQAFLGSTPQLTLQLYATIQEKYLLPTRSKNRRRGVGSSECGYL